MTSRVVHVDPEALMSEDTPPPPVGDDVSLEEKVMAAQTRFIKAMLGAPMHPTQAAVGSYCSVGLLEARHEALHDLIMRDDFATLTPPERERVYRERMLAQFTDRAQQLEGAGSRLIVAQPMVGRA